MPKQPDTESFWCAEAVGVMHTLTEHHDHETGEAQPENAWYFRVAAKNHDFDRWKHANIDSHLDLRSP